MARGKRPRRRPATEQRNELPPPHVFLSGRGLHPATPPERLCITAAIRVTDHLRAGSLVSYGTDLANAYHET